MSAPPINAIGPVATDPTILRGSDGPTTSPPVRGASFSQLLLDGIDHVNQQLSAADAKIEAFALDDTIPPHQVILAVEDARHSLELLLQVRSRLIEGYQEIMRMQL